MAAGPANAQTGLASLLVRSAWKIEFTNFPWCLLSRVPGRATKLYDADVAIAAAIGHSSWAATTGVQAVRGIGPDD